MPIVLLKLSLQLLGLEAASVSVPVVVNEPVPAALFDHSVASPVRKTVGVCPAGVEPSLPRSTGLLSAVLNFLRSASEIVLSD